MRNLIAVSVVGSLALGLLVAGCGGSDDSGQIDKAAFIAQANKVCEQASGKLAAEAALINRRAAENPNSDFDKTQVALVEEGLIPTLEEEQEKIRALGIPEDAKKEVEALLEAYRKAIDLTKEKTKIVALTERLAPHEAVAITGTRFGVTECPISPVENTN